MVEVGINSAVILINYFGRIDSLLFSLLNVRSAHFLICETPLWFVSTGWRPSGLLPSWVSSVVTHSSLASIKTRWETTWHYTSALMT
jgi:hypothetical protein